MTDHLSEEERRERLKTMLHDRAEILRKNSQDQNTGEKSPEDKKS